MAEYSLERAISAVVEAITDPGFLLAMAILALVIAALVIYERHREPTKRDIEIRRCRETTSHRIDKKPLRPLSVNYFQRIPGHLYSQQTCLCGYRTRVRWLGGPNSKRAIAYRNDGGQPLQPGRTEK